MRALVPPTSLAVSPLSWEYFNTLPTRGKLAYWHSNNCIHNIEVEGDRVMVGAQHVLAAIYLGIPRIWVTYA